MTPLTRAEYFSVHGDLRRFLPQGENYYSYAISYALDGHTQGHDSNYYYEKFHPQLWQFARTLNMAGHESREL